MASLLKPKKHLSFNALMKVMTTQFNLIDDTRKQGMCDYSFNDVMMSAFACMYFQDPSLAEFQQRAAQDGQSKTLKALFGINKVPKNLQLRVLLDTVSSEKVFNPIFTEIFNRLRRHKHLEPYKMLGGKLLCAVDGTTYHSSKEIHCNCCLQKKHTNGSVTYQHGVLQGAIIHPDKRQVIPVMPEAIKNVDGSKKQDCEYNATKRFLINLKKAHSRSQFIIVADGLASHQSMIEATLGQGMSYLFVAKPLDHKYMFEWIDTYQEIPTFKYKDARGRTHHYRWQNTVPLNGRADAIQTNYIEYQLENESGKITYKNSWVTDIEINKENAIEIVNAGRCRWKIENECFNTLKNQGYNVCHNYGHGDKNLSYNMYLLTLLAFTVHQIFELTDGVYQACRKNNLSKRYLWERFRSVISHYTVLSWESLMDFVLNKTEYLNEIPELPNSHHFKNS
jgi:hypothetical protein